MAGAVHVIDAGPGASALLAAAVAAMAPQEGQCVVALGSSAGRAILTRGGVRIDAWASPPCGMMRLAARPLARAVLAASGGREVAELLCWSADPGRAASIESCARGALPRAQVQMGSLPHAARVLGAHAAQVMEGDRADGEAAAARRAARESIGARESSVVVLGAADAPLAVRPDLMLDVAGRAMLAGADLHLVVPACMPHLDRTQRYARGLGLDGRVHVVEGADWPRPWWQAADALLVAGQSPLAESFADAIGLSVIRAPADAADALRPERRAATAAVRDASALSLVAAARARAQSAMNASAASA
jgi:hypothetical protein